jgi:phosphatidylinositol dimannoside acyltransferase
MARDLLARAPLIKYVAWRLARVLARDLTAAGAGLLARFGGELMWWCDAGGRRTLDANLTLLIPDAPARARAVRRCYLACADHLAHMLRLDRVARKPRAVQLCDPWGVFDSATTSHGRRGPLILATLHQDWTRILAALHAHGLVDDLAVVALPAGGTWVDGELTHLHQCLEATVLPWAGAARGALQHLRRGGVLGLLADRDYAGDGITMHCQGHAWRVPSGPAKLALHSGAPLVPFVWIRETLVVGQPLAVRNAAEVISATRALARFQLRVLAANPSRWVAFHPLMTRV